VIAKQLGLVSAAPFIIDADASPVPGGWPKGGTAVIALPNNHLTYAFTCFALGFALFCVFAAYAWQNRRRIA
jgi:surfeit locus 1 family protein